MKTEKPNNDKKRNNSFSKSDEAEEIDIDEIMNTANYIYLEEH